MGPCTNNIIDLYVVLVCTKEGQSIDNLLVLSESMSTFGHGEFGKATIFHFPFKRIFSNWAVSTIAFATIPAFAAGAFLAPSASSNALVSFVVTGLSIGVSVSVCLRHDNISFVLYELMW